MSTDRDFKMLVKRKLMDIDSCIEVSGNPDQLQMRCPFCGDSKKDPNKKRLYIKLNQDDPSSPIVYNCFNDNCDASGVLTASTLRSFNIHDMQLSGAVTAYNKNVVGKINKKLGYSSNNFNFEIPRPKNTANNRLKKKYIEDRLGLKLTAQELVDLRVVFSITDFIDHNHLEYHAKPFLYKLFENDYIGFLTAKKEFINLRDITNKNKLRYYKYPIFKQLENTRKFYTLPSTIDILSNDKIVINVAEGVFDILGIYYHVYNKNTTNIIYAAVCGAAYTIVLKHFIKMGFVGSNIVINIFSDQGIEPHTYRKMYDDIIPWVGEINLFYNTKSKDCGVHKEDIELIKRKIR